MISAALLFFCATQGNFPMASRIDVASLGWIGMATP